MVADIDYKPRWLITLEKKIYSQVICCQILTFVNGMTQCYRICYYTMTDVLMVYIQMINLSEYMGDANYFS